MSFGSKEKRDKKLRNVSEFHTIFGIQIEAVIFETVIDQEKMWLSTMAYGVNHHNSKKSCCFHEDVLLLRRSQINCILTYNTHTTHKYKEKNV